MAHHDVVLPPCVYPASKPYGGFTTLVHRYGQYDRVRTSTLSELTRSRSVSSTTTSSSSYSHEMPSIHEIEVSDDGSNTQLVRMRSVGGGAITKRDRNAAIEAISNQMNKPAMREYQDQRVVLSAKKEIKLELARMGSAVEKFQSSF